MQTQIENGTNGNGNNKRAHRQNGDNNTQATAAQETSAPVQPEKKARKPRSDKGVARKKQHDEGQVIVEGMVMKGAEGLDINSRKARNKLADALAAADAADAAKNGNGNKAPVTGTKEGDDAEAQIERMMAAGEGEGENGKKPRKPRKDKGVARKNKQAAQEEAPQAASEQPTQEAAAPAEPEKKARKQRSDKGVPRKHKQEAAQETTPQAAPTTNDKPRGRGRRPAWETQMAHMQSAPAAQANTEEAPKRRGRPPKAQAAAEAVQEPVTPKKERAPYGSRLKKDSPKVAQIMQEIQDSDKALIKAVDILFKVNAKGEQGAGFAAPHRKVMADIAHDLYTAGKLNDMQKAWLRSNTKLSGRNRLGIYWKQLAANWDNWNVR